jgi:hypothetical protein
MFVDAPGKLSRKPLSLNSTTPFYCSPIVADLAALINRQLRIISPFCHLVGYTYLPQSLFAQTSRVSKEALGIQLVWHKFPRVVGMAMTGRSDSGAHGRIL